MNVTRSPSASNSSCPSIILGKKNSARLFDFFFHSTLHPFPLIENHETIPPTLGFCAFHNTLRVKRKPGNGRQVWIILIFMVFLRDCGPPHWGAFAITSLLHARLQLHNAKYILPGILREICKPGELCESRDNVYIFQRFRGLPSVPGIIELATNNPSFAWLYLFKLYR